MAVQQNRKTSSKRGMRRAHDGLKGPTLSVDQTTGETHRRNGAHAQKVTPVDHDAAPPLSSALTVRSAAHAAP